MGGNLIVKLFRGIWWRAEQCIQPYYLLDGGFIKTISRIVNNIMLVLSGCKIVYVFADCTNIGDKLSNAGIRKILDIEGVTVYSSQAGLLEFRLTLCLLKLLKRDPLLIIGGGGMLQGCFNSFFEKLMSMNVKFMLIGIGANMMEFQRSVLHNDLLEKVCKRAIIIHVRDDYTYKICSKFDLSNLHLGVCPSVNYLFDKFKEYRNPVQREYLLYVHHESDIRMAGYDVGKVEGAIEEVADLLDLSYRKINNITIDYSELLPHYCNAKYVISSRLHGCIFSYALQIPFVGIVTDKKIKNFVKTHFQNGLTVAPDFDKFEVENYFTTYFTRNNNFNELITSKVHENIVFADKAKLELKRLGYLNEHSLIDVC